MQLRAEIRDLDLDLDWELMEVYCLNRWDDQFLDCYVRLVAQLPADHPPGISVWTLYALRCAQRCGRAEEVAAALRRVIRFQPNLHSTQAIREVQGQWETGHPPASEVSQR